MLQLEVPVARNSKKEQEDKIPVYVTPTGGRYVKTEEFLGNREIQEMLRNLPDLIGVPKFKPNNEKS